MNREMSCSGNEVKRLQPLQIAFVVDPVARVGPPRPQQAEAVIVIHPYTREVNCIICGARKARRHCPGVRGDICSICCATGREESIDCPLDCTYLRDAHLHEKAPEFDPAVLPNADIKVTEDFLRGNEILMAFLATAIYQGALAAPGCTDYDVRVALEALVKTYRTLNAGLYYETLPVNPFAAGIATSVQVFTAS